MITEKQKNEIVDLVATSILRDPYSENTIYTHFKLAINTDDEIQAAIFRKILEKSLNDYKSAGDIEESIQNQYLEYFENAKLYEHPKSKTRARRYIHTYMPITIDSEMDKIMILGKIKPL